MFEASLRKSLSNHGMPNTIIAKNANPRDAYILDYTASQSWDMGMFVSLVDLSIKRNNQHIASGHYDAGGVAGRGGLDFSKYNSTQSKLDYLVGSLVARLKGNP